MLTAPVARLPVASFGRHPVPEAMTPLALVLVMERLKPPWKKPQEMPAAFNRSPMFLPDMLKYEVVEEQTSLAGSASLMSVKPPWPSGMTVPVVPTWLMTPLVWPEMRLMAPGVEGPKVEPKEWSLRP